MNRLAPLVSRYARRSAPARALRLPPPMSRADEAVAQLFEASSGVAGDLRLFVTAWFAGLIFFGTLIA